MEKEKNKRRGSMQTKACRTLRDDRNACDFRSDCLGILAFWHLRTLILRHRHVVMV